MPNTYRKAVLNLLAQRDYTPSTPAEIARQLDLEGRAATQLNREVEAMLHEGSAARVKGDRVCLPKDADLIPGRIRFRQTGKAILLPDTPPGERPAGPVSIRAEDTGVALHGDHVLVRITPPKRRREELRGRGKGKGRSKGGVTPLQPTAQERPEGRVIRILERARTQLAGTLKRARTSFYVIPDDPRIVHDILVSDPARSHLFPRPKLDDKVVVRLEEWEQRHLNPEGEITAVLGKTHTPSAEHQALLLQFALCNDFPEPVMEEVAKVPKKVGPGQVKGRLDCRPLFTFTIDPDDAKDFDDALSIEATEGGGTRVGVHIADVSAYVRAGSALDREGQERGNSTYLVGQVIPMLPHALSNGICSLVEAEDRLVKSVFFHFSKGGKVTRTEFANSVIRSDKRLTYAQAYALMTQDDLRRIRALPVPPAHQTGSTGRALAELSESELQRLQRGVRQLWDFASQMRSARMKRGSLDLDTTEIKIYVDEEGYADRVVKVENDESHQLIEEFMLAANEAVDREITGAGLPLLHRVHDSPDPERLDELRELLATYGIESGDLTRRAGVTRLLESIKAHPQGYTLKIEFLRSLKKACYRAEGDGHYGLAKTYYTHFTSPIRRYADLVVHRVFDRYLEKTGSPYGPRRKVEPYPGSRLASIAQHVSLTEVNSTEAERESVKSKLLEYFERELKKPTRAVFDAVVTDVVNHGLFVELTETMTFGLVHVSTMKDDLYRLSPEGDRLVGRQRRKTFEVGGRIKVSVEKVDRYKRQIDFKLAEDQRGEAARGSGPEKGSGRAAKVGAQKKVAGKGARESGPEKGPRKRAQKKVARKSARESGPVKEPRKKAGKRNRGKRAPGGGRRPSG